MSHLDCRCGSRLKTTLAHVNHAMRCPACKQLLRLVAAPDAMLDSPVALLVVERGPSLAGTLLYLAGDKPIAFGSDAHAALRLADAGVAAAHGTFEPSGRSWRIIDTQSPTGVLVNRKRVVAQVLAENDVVQVGGFQLRYHTVEQLRAQTSKKAATPPAPARPAASPEKRAAPPPPPLPGEAGAAAGLTFLHDPHGAAPASSGDDEIKFAADEDVFPTKPAPVPGRPPGVVPTCPQCRQQLPPEARICVACGIDLATGKSLLEGRGSVIETAAKHPDRQPPRGARSVQSAEVTASSDRVGVYFADCLRAWVFPANISDLLRFIFVALVLLVAEGLSRLPWVGGRGMGLLFLGWAAAYGVYVNFLFSIVQNAASGERDLPELAWPDGLGGIWDDGLVPVFKFFLVSLLAFGPAAAYGIYTDFSLSTLPSTGADPIVLALAAWGIFVWPIIMLVVAIGGVGPLLRPDLMLVTVARTIGPYAVVCAMTALATSAAGFVQLGSEKLAGKLNLNPFAVAAILRLLDLYCMIIAMQAIGLYYHHFKRRFAWSWG